MKDDVDRRRQARDGPRYVPALAFRALTPLYDPAMRFIFDEPALKARLIRQAGLRGSQRVLDLGCGTGTLLLMLGESHPDCELWGLDGDRAVLARARRKLASGRRRSRASDCGPRRSDALRPGALDRVLSSLFFHHLPSAIKGPVLEAALRALRPRGELHVLDFGRPSNIRTNAVVSFLRLFDGLDNTRDNARSLLPQRMAEAGFADISEIDRVDTRVGTVTYCCAPQNTAGASGLGVRDAAERVECRRESRALLRSAPGMEPGHRHAHSEGPVGRRVRGHRRPRRCGRESLEPSLPRRDAALHAMGPARASRSTVAAGAHACPSASQRRTRPGGRYGHRRPCPSRRATFLPGGTLDLLDLQQAILDDLEGRAARQGLTNIVPRQGDARSLPYPDRTFDAANLVAVLGEIPNPQAALRELHRVLKPDGRLVVSEILVDPDFISLDALRQKARDAGFVFSRAEGPCFAYCPRCFASSISRRRRCLGSGFRSEHGRWRSGLGLSSTR